MNLIFRSYPSDLYTIVKYVIFFKRNRNQPQTQYKIIFLLLCKGSFIPLKSLSCCLLFCFCLISSCSLFIMFLFSRVCLFFCWILICTFLLCFYLFKFYFYWSNFLRIRLFPVKNFKKVSRCAENPCLVFPRIVFTSRSVVWIWIFYE